MHYADTGFMHKMAGMAMVPSLVYALREFMHYYVMHYEHIDCSGKSGVGTLYIYLVLLVFTLSSHSHHISCSLPLSKSSQLVSAAFYVCPSLSLLVDIFGALLYLILLLQ